VVPAANRHKHCGHFLLTTIVPQNAHGEVRDLSPEKESPLLCLSLYFQAKLGHLSQKG